EDLERDDAVHLLLVRAVDDPHAATGDLIDDDVAADRRAGERLGVGGSGVGAILDRPAGYGRDRMRDELLLGGADGRGVERRVAVGRRALAAVGAVDAVGAAAAGA